MNENVKPKSKKGVIIVLIIVLVLLIGLVIFLGVKLLSPKDNNEPPKIENKILYTFTDPLNNKISIIKKDILDEEYIGVDLTRYEDKEDEVRKTVRSYVLKDSEVKALDLSDEYKKTYNTLLKKIRGRNGGGFSLESLKEALKNDSPSTSNEVIDYVVKNSNIDWNDQTLLLVYKYLGWGHSKDYINEKLVNEFFTEDEVEYAMNEIKDVDFYEQALEKACYYRFYKKYEKDKTIKWLNNENYTEEEINYAIKTAYEEIK